MTSLARYPPLTLISCLCCTPGQAWGSGRRKDTPLNTDATKSTKKQKHQFWKEKKYNLWNLKNQIPVKCVSHYGKDHTKTTYLTVRIQNRILQCGWSSPSSSYSSSFALFCSVFVTSNGGKNRWVNALEITVLWNIGKTKVAECALFGSSWEMLIMSTTRKQCWKKTKTCQRVSKFSLWALLTFKWLLTFQLPICLFNPLPTLAVLNTHQSNKGDVFESTFLSLPPCWVVLSSGPLPRSCSVLGSLTIPPSAHFLPSHLLGDTGPIPEATVGKATLTLLPGLLQPLLSLVHPPRSLSMVPSPNLLKCKSDLT